MGAMKNAILEEAGKAGREVTAKILVFPDPRLYAEQIERLIANRIEAAFMSVLFPGGTGSPGDEVQHGR